MKRRASTVHLDVTDRDDREWHITATVSPGRHGRYGGPPEDCYPDEPPEINTFDARCLDTGQRIDDMNEFAFVWCDECDDSDVADAIIEQYESGDDDPGWRGADLDE